MSTPGKTEWFTPQTVMMAIGSAGALIGAWMSFEGRISTVEQAQRFHHDMIVESRQDLKDINAKLDRLIERRSEGKDK